HDTDTSTPYASCLQYSWHSAISSEELTTCFFFNDTPTTEIYTLSLHDALPICLRFDAVFPDTDLRGRQPVAVFHLFVQGHPEGGDRKSTRLNSSHVSISYAVFCLKKKKITACRGPSAVGLTFCEGPCGLTGSVP